MQNHGTFDRHMFTAERPLLQRRCYATAKRYYILDWLGVKVISKCYYVAAATLTIGNGYYGDINWTVYGLTVLSFCIRR